MERPFLCPLMLRELRVDEYDSLVFWYTFFSTGTLLPDVRFWSTRGHFTPVWCVPHPLPPSSLSPPWHHHHPVNQVVHNLTQECSFFFFETTAIVVVLEVVRVVVVSSNLSIWEVKCMTGMVVIHIWPPRYSFIQDSLFIYQNPSFSHASLGHAALRQTLQQAVSSQSIHYCALS